MAIVRENSSIVYQIESIRPTENRINEKKRKKIEKMAWLLLRTEISLYRISGREGSCP